MGRTDASRRTMTPPCATLRFRAPMTSGAGRQGLRSSCSASTRRITQDFGESVSVGSTSTLEGVEFPYRPACVDWAKGTQGHAHGFHQCWPLKLLNIVVGAVNVPGGILSTGAAGKYPHDWWPEGSTDGMLEHGGQLIPSAHPSAFPGFTPTKPTRADIGELFPMASHYHALLPVTVENPSAFG